MRSRPFRLVVVSSDLVCAGVSLHSNRASLVAFEFPTNGARTRTPFKVLL